jgi:hypothetical protein
MCESLFVLVVEVKQREEKRKEEKGKWVWCEQR